ncbi:phage antirepressor KilAC domain-containing protein [Paenibacillus sp. LPE1-1-1.1]|uniref:phage antirepressor KilAC domain-containing protein n=1 Tax=Paenibacillus sp. LPE1-1-1.1 TaxID=3135230 RepID=UPI00342C1A0D
MNQQLQQVFIYAGNSVRTVMVGSEPWFIAKDVCTILEVNNVGQALTRLDADERTDLILNDGSQGRNFSAVSESGLYSLILSSRKPQARGFRKWVTSEVLPSIRKTGGYNALAVPSYAIDDRVARAKRWIEEEETRQALQLETQRQATLLLVQAPKISYYDSILRSNDALSVTQIAKDYGLGPAELNQILKDAGVQYKSGNQWVLKSAYVGNGYSKSETFVNESGGTRVYTKWTQRGRLFIHELLTERGIEPGGKPKKSRRRKRPTAQKQQTVTLTLSLPI